jgi:hypothetical protein
MATVKVDVPVRAPMVAPGMKVTEALKAGLYVCKGPSWSISDGTGLHELFRIPPNTFVYDVIVEIKTATDATGTTITIGDSDDTDGFYANNTITPMVLGSKSTRIQPTAAGAPTVYAGGKFYSDSDGRVITASIKHGAAASDKTTVGKFDTYLAYMNYSDLL